MEKRISAFAEIYNNRREILENPGQYPEEITLFSVGENCSDCTNNYISVAQLVSCWQHEEYMIKCPKCGEVAYVTRWIGNVGRHHKDKLYWLVRAYCPHCNTNDYVRSTELKASWKEMLKLVPKMPNKSEKTNGYDGSKFTVAEAYANMSDILEHPEQYSETITNFLAGGLGCCVYSRSVSVAELVRCWQHKEYQVECPRCGSVAYVYKWVGHVGPGGYWTVRVYCLDCMTEYSSINILKYSWCEMRKIYDEVVGELNVTPTNGALKNNI